MGAFRAWHAGIIVSFSILLGSGPAAQSPSDTYPWLELAQGSGAGSPVISAKGALRPGGSVQITVTAKAGQLCKLVFGTSATLPGAAYAGANVVLSQVDVEIPVKLDLLGKSTRTFAISDSIPSVYIQAVTLDALGHVEISNAVGANRGHQWVSDPKQVTWTPRTGHGVAVLGNDMFLIGGRPGVSALNDVHRYTGAKWEQLLANDPLTTTRFAPTTRAAVAEHAGRLWVGLGTTNTGPGRGLWSSADGKVWSLENSDLAAVGGPGPRDGARAISFLGKLFIVGGYYKASLTQKPTAMYLNEVWSRDANGAWTKTTAPWRGRTDHAIAIHNGRLYVVGGSSVLDDSIPYSSMKLGDVWSTANGITWTQHTPAAEFSPDSGHIVCSFAGQLRLFGGYGNTYNYQWRSTSGDSWAVPLELGGPGYNFGNKPIPSAAKAAMPDVVRYFSESAIYQGRLWSLGGFTISPEPYDPVIYSD